MASDNPQPASTVLQRVTKDVGTRLHQEREVAAKATAHVIRAVVQPLQERVAELERRLEETPTAPALVKGLDGGVMGRLVDLEKRVLECERTGLRYCGVYGKDKAYRLGDVVSFRGSMWVAREPVSKGEAPGRGLPWQLAVKKGRSGKPYKANNDSDEGNDEDNDDD